MSQIKQRVANSIFKLLPQQGTTYCINEPVTVPADFCGMNYINYPSPLATGYYTPNPYSVGAQYLIFRQTFLRLLPYQNVLET